MFYGILMKSALEALAARTHFQDKSPNLTKANARFREAAELSSGDQSWDPHSEYRQGNFPKIARRKPGAVG